MSDKRGVGYLLGQVGSRVGSGSEVLCVSVVVLITTVVTLSRAGDAKYPNSSDDVMKIVLANPVIVILIFAVRDMPTCRGNLL